MSRDILVDSSACLIFHSDFGMSTCTPSENHGKLECDLHNSKMVYEPLPPRFILKSLGKALCSIYTYILFTEKQFYMYMWFPKWSHANKPLTLRSMHGHLIIECVHVSTHYLSPSSPRAGRVKGCWRSFMMVGSSWCFPQTLNSTSGRYDTCACKGWAG